MRVSVFLLFGLLLFLAEFKYNNHLYEFTNYIIFLFPIFFYSIEAQLIIASLVFLYGLPTGTLLK